jgi:hypothetical protein
VITARLADHSHQAISSRGETRFLQVLLAKGDRIIKTTLVSQLRCAPEQK